MLSFILIIQPQTAQYDPLKTVCYLIILGRKIGSSFHYKRYLIQSKQSLLIPKLIHAN